MSETPHTDAEYRAILHRESSDDLPPSKWSYEAILDLYDWGCNLERAFSSARDNTLQEAIEVCRTLDKPGRYWPERCMRAIGALRRKSVFPEEQPK